MAASQLSGKKPVLDGFVPSEEAEIV